MGPSKEKFNPLANRSDEKLRELWDQADNTPGERVGDFTKGQISQEITRRNKETVGQKPRKRQPVNPFPPNFIDGSWGMMGPNERGAIINRSKR